MSAQANSLRVAFQKNEQMKKEMQHLRANLVMMRKNVIKKPRKNSALSDMGGKRAKLNMEEEKAEITAPEVGEVLALPSITLMNQKQKQRPGSMATRREDDMLVSPPIIPSRTDEEVKSSQSNRSRKRSFLTKVIKMNEIDHSIREREEKEKADEEERLR